MLAWLLELPGVSWVVERVLGWLLPDGVQAERDPDGWREAPSDEDERP